MSPTTYTDDGRVIQHDEEAPPAEAFASAAKGTPRAPRGARAPRTPRAPKAPAAPRAPRAPKAPKTAAVRKAQTQRRARVGKHKV